LSLFSCSSQEGKQSIVNPKSIRLIQLDSVREAQVIEFDNGSSIAYDQQSALLFSYWQGVIDSIAPGKYQRLGDIFIENDFSKQWLAIKGKDSVVLDIKVKSIDIINNQTMIKWVISNNNLSGEINETLELTSDNLLTRQFQISLSDTTYNVAMPIKESSIVMKEDLMTNGELSITNTNQLTSIDNRNHIELSGYLQLNHGETLYKVSYLMKAIITNSRIKLSDQTNLHPGLVVISNSNCKNCHNKNSKAVGPSYNQIALKYGQDSTSVPYLIKKIKQGGKGVWGDVPMAAHPELSDDDIQLALQYIMSLGK
jgi:cytochrome c